MAKNNKNSDKEKTAKERKLSRNQNLKMDENDTYSNEPIDHISEFLKSENFGHNKKDAAEERTTPSKNRRLARIIAMQTLYQVDWGELSRENAVKLRWYNEKIDPKIETFAKTLIQGSLDNLELIDELIKKYSNHWKFDRIPKVELAILRFSIYSLLFLRDIPPIVIIDEAIEISKVFSSEDAWRYINGMCDAIYHNEVLTKDITQEFNQ